MIERARITALHNGVLIQNNAELYGNTEDKKPALIHRPRRERAIGTPEPWRSGAVPEYLDQTAVEVLQTDATALRRGVLRLQLVQVANSLRCHGLAPWSFTLMP